MIPALRHVQTLLPAIDIVTVQSDGPVNQYRNRKNFYLISTIPFRSGFRNIIWNFWESRHVKGAPDGVGAAVKRRADSFVAHGKDIPNARLVIIELSQLTYAVTLFFVAETAIARCDALLP